MKLLPFDEDLRHRVLRPYAPIYTDYDNPLSGLAYWALDLAATA